ncbi:hypothetical protein IEJ02_34165 [Streptomyces sp. 5-10]|nr:hypothetical protein [Streptomyces sp. 5-10]
MKEVERNLTQGDQMKLRERLVLPGIAFAALALPLGAAPSAQAGQAGPDSSVAGTARNCTVQVKTGAVACYDTFRNAILHATSGAVADAPLDARTAAADPAFTRRLNALVKPDGSPVPGVTSIPLSASFQHPNRGGSTWIDVADRGCDNDTGVEYSRSNIADYDEWWDDRISSFEGYANCEPNMYEDHGFKGAQTGWHRSLMDMGAMEDKASSIKWR